MKEQNQKQYGILDLLWDVRDLTLPVKPSAKQVLSALILRCSPPRDGYFRCFPSIRQVVSDTQLDRKTVLAAIDVLEGANLVSVIREKKPASKESAVNQYTISADLVRTLKAKQQGADVTTDDLADEYLCYLRLRQGVDAAIADMDKHLGEIWEKLWAKLLADARESFSSGGLDAVRFPAYVDADPIFRLTQGSMRLPGSDPDFFLPVDIPPGHEIKGVRAEDGTWRFQVVVMHRYRFSSERDIAAEYDRQEQESGQLDAEYDAAYADAQRLIVKIGADAYRAWLRVAFWDEEHSRIPVTATQQKDVVIARLRAEQPGIPYIAQDQPEWGHEPLPASYREQALNGVHPPAWASS